MDTHYPVITAADGRVMDGMHRICRAIIEGRQHLDVVQFPEDPEPTYTNARPEALPYLRLAKPEDAAAIAELEAQCQVQFAGAGRADLAALEPESAEHVQARIRTGGVTVAYRNLDPDSDASAETIVGWISIKGAASKDSGPELYLSQVSVAPDQQGQKIGSLLIRSALLEARVGGASTMILNTERDIAWNRPLYEHLGWHVVPEAEWTDQMQRQVEYQTAAGLDWSTRVHMRTST